MKHDEEPNPQVVDLTPSVGSATDVAPIGPLREKPAHELTADEDADLADWNRVLEMPEFRGMLKAKARFVLPATLFFIVYYFALPVLVGYAPEWAATKLFGAVNIAYVFALSQFFMAWTIAALYLRAAARFDDMERRIVDKAVGRREGNPS